MSKTVDRHNTQRKLSRLCRFLLVAIAFTTICQTVGCSSWKRMGIADAVMLSYRDKVWARRAYNLRYGNCDRPYADHFQSGFCAGYGAQCNGGDGYVPALPPEDYRSYEFQSADGAQCVNAWFEGYPAGVAAAKKDKAGTYHDVMVSRMIDSAIAQEKIKPILPGDVPVVPVKATDNNGLQGQPGQPAVRQSSYSATDSNVPSVMTSEPNFDSPQDYLAPGPRVMPNEFSTMPNSESPLPMAMPSQNWDQ